MSDEVIVKSKGGRPKGSKNKPKRKLPLAKKRDLPPEVAAADNIVNLYNNGKYVPATIDPDEMSENTFYLQNAMKVASLDPIDQRNAQQVSQRAFEYFSFMAQQGQKPSVAGLALAFRLSRSQLLNIANGNVKSYPRETIDEYAYALSIMNVAIEDWMQNGKIQPVAGIWLTKNNHGYKDQQEVVITHNDPLGDEKDPEKIRQKYMDSIVSDVIDND